jgi:hypothetical protein
LRGPPRTRGEEMGGGNGGVKSSSTGKGRYREGRRGTVHLGVTVSRIALQGFGYLIGDKVRGYGATLAAPGEMLFFIPDQKSEDTMSSVFQKLRIQWGTGGGTVCNGRAHITIPKAKERRSSRVDAGRKYGPEFSSDAEGDGPEEEAGHSKEEKLLGFHAGIFRKGGNTRDSTRDDLRRRPPLPTSGRPRGETGDGRELTSRSRLSGRRRLRRRKGKICRATEAAGPWLCSKIG